MPRINILPAELINLIAAGEVVERPASAVKELVENAIDSGATRITIETKAGGTEFIRVTDDGCGIPFEDISTAFTRHATSKIAAYEDLSSIHTMGFRGEALAAIASVADVEITTKESTAQTGGHAGVASGEVSVVDEVGCADGTVISVSNIFANIPARRKFLKSPGTESGYCGEAITRLMLGAPNIAIKYISNGAMALQTEGKGLDSAFHAIYGAEVARNTLPISFLRGVFDITGICGQPSVSRANRRYINVFLNGRYIKNRTIEAAIMNGYAGRLTVGRFPMIVININIDPRRIDVNVHPSKTEAKFLDDSLLFSAVRDAVSGAFSSCPAMPQRTMANPLADDFKIDPNAVLRVADPMAALRMPEYQMRPIESSAYFEEIAAAEIPFTIIGQVFSTYWIVTSGDRAYIIDQHAAHERVLYERLIERFVSETPDSQRLAMPVAVALSPAEAAALIENLEILEGFGYDIEEIGDGSYAVRAVPIIFGSAANAGFLAELLDKLSLPESSIQNLYDTKVARIAQMSCKAAVKGGDRLSPLEARAIIRDMMKLKDPFHCPHGRPTIVELEKGVVEKMFLRK